MKNIRISVIGLLSAVLLGLSASASAGPVIIAGTDADDHGFFNGTDNVTGWLFMQKAFENLAPAVTNGQTSIVCIGCNSSQAGNAFSSATSQSSLAGTWTFSSLTSVADIAAFFDGTGATNVNNAGVVYMPTVVGNVSGGINDTQLAIVNANSAALNTFVIGGGGLFTQEQANSAIGYGWLSALLPGLVVQGDNGGPGFDSDTINLTAAGNSAFPGLTDGDMSAATPWHAWFSGNFGGLNTLATGPIFGVTGGTFPGAVVIGGGAGTVFQCGGPNEPPCETPEPDSVALLGLGVAGMLWAIRRRTPKAG